MVFSESNSTCKNGHTRTNENTGLVESKGRIYLDCLECRFARDVRRGRHDPKRPHQRDRKACSNGHAYVPGSYSEVLVNGAVVRRCKECSRANTKRYRERRALVKKAERERLNRALSRYSIFS